MLIPILERSSLQVSEDSLVQGEGADANCKDIYERSESLQRGNDRDNQLYVAHCPERVLPGRILEELVDNDRIIGGYCRDSAQMAKELYASFVEGEIFITDATTAEMVKLMENTTRDINIAIANEFARLSERFGIDVWEAIQLANLHPRIDILRPGPGVGGHCISVDPWFLVEAAPDLTPLIHTARKVNDAQPEYIVGQLLQAFQAYSQDTTQSLKGRRIAALGLAYKPDIDDLRESPAIDVVKRLQAAGAEVTAFEPYKADLQIPGLRPSQNLGSTLHNAEAIILLVRHSKLMELDPMEMNELTQTRLVFDAVNGWPIQPWCAAGFHVYKLGVGLSPAIVPSNQNAG
jgi:UDP-N-acetyl-D-mannosaminuronic acid dehydrogenase